MTEESDQAICMVASPENPKEKVLVTGPVADMILALIHYRERIEEMGAGAIEIDFQGKSVKMKLTAALPVSSLRLGRLGKLN